MKTEYAEDCIHLKACRRARMMAKSKFHGGYLALGCSKDACTAYVCGKSTQYITLDDALYVAHSQYDGRSDAYDVYAGGDFPSRTLNEIIEEAYK